MVQEMPPEGGMQIDPDEELPAMQRSFAGLIKRSLILWAIRWTLGFLIIWAVTAWSGRFEWLWTAGLIVAAISLVTTLGAHFFMQRRFASVENLAKGWRLNWPIWIGTKKTETGPARPLELDRNEGGRNGQL